jgi:hypothetical protein
MRKILITAMAITMLLQYAPFATAKTMELSTADFGPKRASFCEIFVEPN